MKNKKNIFIIILAMCLLIVACIKIDNTSELKSIKSQKELNQIYYGKKDRSNIFKYIITTPMSFFLRDYSDVYYGGLKYNGFKSWEMDDISISSERYSGSGSSDYSKTNIQVENVDEADIIKTDGQYIYSLSGDYVVISDTSEKNKVKVVSKIKINEGIAQDLILYKNKLIVISSVLNQQNNWRNTNDTLVSIYNVVDKTSPVLLKSYIIYEPYYTSRLIDGKLYVISSGSLKMENDNVITYYKEDGSKKNIDVHSIKYLKDVKSNTLTVISYLDLNDIKNITINPYLIDVSNAYVSQNNIYLSSYNYDYDNNNKSIKDLFGIKGVFGLIEEDDNYNYWDSYTYIYKFSILDNGSIKYKNKAKVEGSVINQFSFDEYENNLRVALSNSNGSRIVVLDEKLKMIGSSEYLAKGETMYSTRFVSNKAYLVTYQTIDPLFVIDLSNPKDIKTLGELKIPGYSTYLHPYDENHIIGIGMDTKEIINRDSYGRVINKTAMITGMKMALFDVSDVNNPKELSSVSIGDSYTSSAILTNHKALLFSKEKNIIAIPVNNYKQKFELSSSTNINTVIDTYKNASYSYISEGYLVYDISVQDGIKLKGSVVHDKNNRNYYYNSRLLRGLYIDNNLYTVSESKIKINNLDTMKELYSMDIGVN